MNSVLYTLASKRSVVCLSICTRCAPKLQQTSPEEVLMQCSATWSKLSDKTAYSVLSISSTLAPCTVE